MENHQLGSMQIEYLNETLCATSVSLQFPPNYGVVLLCTAITNFSANLRITHLNFNDYIILRIRLSKALSRSIS